MNSSSIDKKEIRRFGTIAFIFFGILFALALWRQKIFLKIIFGFLSMFGFALLIAPVHLRTLYSAWIKAGAFIGKIFNLIALTIVYYFVITPVALLKKIISGSPLPVHPDKNSSTYWIKRTEPVQPNERFIKRY